MKGEGIFNLSGKPLTQEEIGVLDKGLKYAPVKNLDKFETYIQIQKYVRTLNIKKYIASNPFKKRAPVENSDVVHSSLRNKSIFNPPVNNNKHVDVFKKAVFQELKDLKIKKSVGPKYIKCGINKLIKRKDIVIRPADKGGGIVVLSKVQYKETMNKLLEDRDTYALLPSNPIFKCRKALEQVIHLGLKKNILNKKEAKYLIPESCRTPVLYSMPKIHKDNMNPPPRPIVNGIDSLTARIGQYLDNYLQPVVKQTTAYLRDTKQVLQLIEELPKGDTPWILATADVASLYTIIQHYQACEATKWGLRKYSTLSCFQRKYLIKCLDFCLKNSYFWYDRIYYHQKIGVAMGAKFAPSVACILCPNGKKSRYSRNPQKN